jgi:hypothetical protein
MPVTFNDIKNMFADAQSELDRVSELRRNAYALALLCQQCIDAQQRCDNTLINTEALSERVDSVLAYFNPPRA